MNHLQNGSRPCSPESRAGLPTLERRRGSLLFTGIAPLFVLLACGCSLSPSSTLDGHALALARAGLQREERPPLPGEDLPEAREGPRGSVWIGELIAIFPGMLVHGLGHTYAGDHRTGSRLRHMGEFGYVLMAVGGGLGVGGYYLDQEDQQGLAYSLYGTGGVIAVAGVTYFFTAWIYDMIDTPRAVRTGGEPPPRSEFIEGLDIFE